jgi:thymidylate synthase
MIVQDGVLNYAFHDINQAYPDMQKVVKLCGELEDTRNGMATVLPGPVIVTHYAPWRRVLFDPRRDCNPFFHYMESIWMLAGSENVDFPAHFAKNIKEYSDDGITLHGAYGYRWRHAFERDQLEAIQHTLATDPTSRRLVVSMWDPHLDLERNAKDLPCNTQLYFRVVHQKLTMTVLNRSNDLVWGMLGANIVHMSILQEYMANNAGLDVGPMYQFSNNLHVYNGWGEESKISLDVDHWYIRQPTMQKWAFSDRNLDIAEAQHFVENMDEEPFESRIMRDNVLPMYRAHTAYKEKDMDLAVHHARKIYDADWRRACIHWLERRYGNES